MHEQMTHTPKQNKLSVVRHTIPTELVRLGKILRALSSDIPFVV